MYQILLWFSGHQQKSVNCIDLIFITTYRWHYGLYFCKFSSSYLKKTISYDTTGRTFWMTLVAWISQKVHFDSLFWPTIMEKNSWHTWRIVLKTSICSLLRPELGQPTVWKKAEVSLFCYILPHPPSINVGGTAKASDNMTRINIASGKGGAFPH